MNWLDFSLFLEVLVEKGYLYVVEGCLAALAILLVLMHALPKRKLINTEFVISKNRLYIEEEFEVAIVVTANEKVKIQELDFFVECLTVTPDGWGSQKRKSYFFKKEIVSRDVSLYPKCTFEEKTRLKVPEKDTKGHYLPGSFKSLKKKYQIIWEAGYIVKLDDFFERTEDSLPLVVYPVRIGW
jgi:hypothetical protein